MAQPRLKFWGWGYEGEALTPDEIRQVEGAWPHQFHVRQFDLALPPTAEEIRLRPSRLSVPGPLQAICTTEHMETLYEDTVALIEQLGCAPCHFPSLSMGGFIGLRLAARLTNGSGAPGEWIFTSRWLASANRSKIGLQFEDQAA